MGTATGKRIYLTSQYTTNSTPGSEAPKSENLEMKLGIALAIILVFFSMITLYIDSLITKILKIKVKLF